jgi:hypothetical protein
VRPHGLSGIRVGLAVGLLLVFAAVVLTVADASGPVHGPNLWAGTWSTSTGRFALRLMDSEDIANARKEARHAQLFDRLSCRGPQYYRGGYVSGSDTGKMIGCGTPTELTGRYASDRNTTSAGSFSISITTRIPLAFSGSYTPDSGASYPWKGTWQSDFPGDGCCALGLSVSAAKVDLLQTVTLRARPASGTSYLFEIKRTSDLAWDRLASGPSDTYQFQTKIPGHFQVQVTAFSGTNRETSPRQDLEVRFPSFREIVDDPEFEAFARAAWQDTLHFASDQGVREEGFWVRLDTCRGRYSKTQTVEGDTFIPGPPPQEQPSVDLGRRPADTAGALPRGCGEYSVAIFHTHPGTTYSEYGKGVGPSADDERAAARADVPALVYDFVEAPGMTGQIPDHWPSSKPATIYHAGVTRRTTPP